jgi:Uma2 family endonuclease
LATFFETRRKSSSVFARTELRLRIRANLILIPGVTVFHPDEPQQRYPDQPPYVAIEILSLDDKLIDVREKLEMYHNWGVPHVWLVDPHSRRMYTCDAGLMEVPTLELPDLNLTLASAELFD